MHPAPFGKAGPGRSLLLFRGVAEAPAIWPRSWPTRGGFHGGTSRDVVTPPRHQALVDQIAVWLSHPAAPWSLFLLLVMAPILWGAHPRFSWDVDNIAPGSVLKGMAAGFGPGWFSSYGPLPYYLTAALYAPILLIAHLTGQLGAPTAAYPWGFQNPEAWMKALVAAARALPVAMAVVVAAMLAWRERRPLDFDADRPVADHRRATLLTLVMLAGSATFVFYSRTSNVDLHALFWIALGFWLLSFSRPRMTHLVAAAAAAACGVCSKEQVAPFSLVIVVVAASWAWKRGGGTRRADTKQPSLRRAALVLGSAAMTYVVLWQLPLNASGWVQHHDFLFTGAKYERSYPLSPAGLLGLFAASVQQLPLVAGWPVWVGVAMAAWRRVPARDLTPQAIASALYVVAFIVPIGYVYPRFLLPLLLLAVPYAIRGWEVMLSQRLEPPRRTAVIAGLALLTALGGPALTVRMLGDSRHHVEAFIARAPEGAVIEVVGNPHFQARVPADMRMLRTDVESLMAEPRPPRGDVVLVSDYGSELARLQSNASLRASFWQPLTDMQGDYRPMKFASSPLKALSLGLPVDPTTTAYVRTRRASRATELPVIATAAWAHRLDGPVQAP